ncbi:hypothetical protein [Candidatus Poriferisodalis sp.]|uniref:hypothetical protein n=1 Tax=Candidatus Poriferisodalis sp. TaxID=3101277 RepID=UPI003B02BE13
MSEYRRGTRVVVNEDLPGVPEGTPGKCGRGLGFAIKRYRVRFDNDVEIISVAHNKLVPEDEWPQFLARRAREEIEAAQERARIAEARAAAAESRGLPAASTDEPAAEPAEAAAADAPAPEAPAADDGGADPRLAAILARSKSAREATGVPAPESSPAPAAESSTDAAESSAAEPTPAPAAAPAAPPPAPAAAPERSAPPSGPERVEIPEFVPGPEVDPDYAPAANRVSELISEARKDG